MDVSSVSRLTPQMVTATVRNTADNDGDAAAHAAARQVKVTQAQAAHAAPAEAAHAAPASSEPAPAEPPQTSSHVDAKA